MINNKSPGFDEVVAELIKMEGFHSFLVFTGYVRLFRTRMNGQMIGLRQSFLQYPRKVIFYNALTVESVIAAKFYSKQ